MPTLPRNTLDARPGLRALRAVPAALVLLLLGSCDSPLDPRLGITPSEGLVEFRAIRGSTTPLTRTITVTNTGGGRLGPVTCPEAPAPWLACAVADGNAVTLTADPTGLATDPERVSVPLTAPGGTGSIDVALTVDQPVLTVSPSTVSFTTTEVDSETTPASATLTVTNTGAGGVSNLGPITCAPTPAAPRVSCSVDQGAGTMTVTVNPENLGPGTHLFPLTVDAEHSTVPQTVTVSVAVSALPRIGLSRQSVHFEAIRGTTTPVVRTVDVSNLGGGQLGAVTCPAQPAAWLTCSVSGNVVTLTAAPDGLTSSPAPVAVAISAGDAVNSPQTVTATFGLEQPVLGLDRSALSFTALRDSAAASPEQDTVRVLNTGAGNLANLGEITCEPPQDAPVTCTVEAGTGMLTVSVDPEDVPTGSHVYPLEVASTHSGVSRTLTVTLSVTEPPTLVLAPSALQFQAIRGDSATSSQTVAVSNAGGGSLGTLSCPASPASWLACTVSDSTLLTISVDPSGLASSPSPVSIQVSATGAANSPVALPVNLVIQQPVLAVSSQQVNFTGNASTGQTSPASAVVTVSNTGAGTLASLGTISCTISAPATCVVAQSAGELTIQVDATGLAAGRHVWLATVSAPNASNGSVTITVILDVS